MRYNIIPSRVRTPQKGKRSLKNWLGRVLRDIENKRENKALSANFLQLIDVSNKLLVQEKNTKKKIYSLHEPEVCCIGKGKDHVRYEFGQQAAIVKTNSGNWIINVEDLPDNIFPRAVGLGRMLPFLVVLVGSFWRFYGGVIGDGVKVRRCSGDEVSFSGTTI